MNTAVTEAPSTTRIVLDRVRISYPRLFVPAQFQGEGQEWYSAAFLIDPVKQRGLVRKLNETAEAAANIMWPRGEWKLKKALGAKAFWWPIREGDEKSDKRGYAGMVFVTAKTTAKPRVVDRALQTVLDTDDVYPGMYVNAAIQFKAFNKPGWGVGCYLQNVQLIGGGERLGGAPDPSEDFKPIDSGDEDEDLLS